MSGVLEAGVLRLKLGCRLSLPSQLTSPGNGEAASSRGKMWYIHIMDVADWSSSASVPKTRGGG